MALQTGPDPQSLLTQALEKLLYLESRLDSAEAAREEAERDRERLRASAQQARHTLADWQRRATDAEVAAEGAEREVSLLRGALGEARQALHVSPTEQDLSRRLREAEERLARYERERETWLDRMVALGRLRSDGEELDLGSFIAELRAELLSLRRGAGSDASPRQRATVSAPPAAPDAAAIIAQSPEPKVDAEDLVRSARLPRPERTLALLCSRDLDSDSAAVRRRAAERLAEAAIAALNPLVMVRLRSEPDARVRVALVKLLDLTGGDGAALVLSHSLRDEDARVRAAALEGLGRRPGADLSSVLADPDPSVRRRALALLPRTTDAIDALADALSDEDAGVRRVAAIVLASRGGAEATALLHAAAHFADDAVAQVAREALSRRGIDWTEPPAEMLRPPAEPAEEPEDVEETEEFEAPEPPPIEADAAPVMPEPVATPEPDPEPETAAVEANPLDERVLDEIRTSLRGRTLDELAWRLGEDELELSDAIDRLIAQGQLVWRGRKLYLP